MASATAMTTRSLALSPAASRQPVAMATPHSVGLPSLQSSSLGLRFQGREAWNSASYSKISNRLSSLCNYSRKHSPDLAKNNGTRRRNGGKSRRIAGKFVAMATGEAPAEVATELPEILKTIQEAWDKLEDKYAVTSLTFFALIVLYGSAGMVSAIDRLPVLPSIFELVGIGYTGWFAYRNIVFKPDREALLAKIKSIYGDVFGSS